MIVSLSLTFRVLLLLASQQRTDVRLSEMLEVLTFDSQTLPIAHMRRCPHSQPEAQLQVVALGKCFHLCIFCACVQEEDYPGAIQLCLECQKAASTFKHYSCIRYCTDTLTQTERCAQQLPLGGSIWAPFTLNATTASPVAPQI